MGFLPTELVLLITFGLIYTIFLFYDIFKRGENYGSLAYVFALLPSNYLWYILTKNEMYEFGAIGAMLVLIILWELCIVRDIILKDKSEGYKDVDDVALVLLIAIILNLIIAAILPAISNNTHMQNGTFVFWKFFYFPDFYGTATNPSSDTVILIYKILTTLLTVSVIVPLLVDLRETKVNIVALLIITLIFAAPFGYLAVLWAGAIIAMIPVLLFLFCVLFFILLLLLTRGMNEK